MCPRNGLRSPLDVELDEDVLDVRFDGLGCDGQSSCDLLVGTTLAIKVRISLSRILSGSAIDDGRTRLGLVSMMRRIAADEAIDVRHKI